MPEARSHGTVWTSPACTSGANMELPSAACCPACSKTYAGHCGATPKLHACLHSEEPPWSKAYVGPERQHFMLVLQRPTTWKPPLTVACGTVGAASLSFKEVGRPSCLQLGDSCVGGASWEEAVLMHHHTTGRHKMCGCCTPLAHHTWLTRTLVARFDAPCTSASIRLVHGASSVVAVPVVEIESVPATELGSVTLCAPRLSSTYDAAVARSWLAHHSALGVRRSYIYSDELIGVSAGVKRLSEGWHGAAHGTVQLIDLGKLRGYPGYYHHQLLSIRDCHARAFASGSEWTLFLDLDELLVAPRDWARLLPKSVESLTFATHHCELDFGTFSRLPGLCNLPPHRKYAMRSTRETPPAQVHMVDPTDRTGMFQSSAGAIHFDPGTTGVFIIRLPPSSTLNTTLAADGEGALWHHVLPFRALFGGT